MTVSSLLCTRSLAVLAVCKSHMMLPQVIDGIHIVRAFRCITARWHYQLMCNVAPSSTTAWNASAHNLQGFITCDIDARLSGFRILSSSALHVAKQIRKHVNLMMLLQMLICIVRSDPKLHGLSTVNTTLLKDIAGHCFVCKCQCVPSRVPSTYSFARFRSVSIHSLCCRPAALFQSPVYSLRSLWTEDRTIKGEGRSLHDVVCSRIHTEWALPCPATGRRLYKSDANVTLQISAHCLLSTSTYAPLRSFDSACSTYAAPLPCISQASSHDAPASAAGSRGTQ